MNCLVKMTLTIIIALQIFFGKSLASEALTGFETVYVDLDGDGFNDLTSDADNDGIPDFGESNDIASMDFGAVEDIFKIDFALTSDNQSKISKADAFSSLNFTVRDLSCFRGGLEAGSDFENGIGFGASCGMICEGGVCRPR